MSDARTDEELAAALVSVDREVTSQIWEGAEELFGPVARNRAFAEDLETARATMRGLALLLARGSDRKAVDRRWKAARKRILAQLSEHTPVTN